MKTDTIFYQLFQSFPSIFFELLDKMPQEAENYQFSSVEIKQLAFRLDGVFIYPNCQVETRKIQRYQELLNPERVTRIYLDELGELSDLSLGLATIKLVTVAQETAIAQGRALVNRTRQQVKDTRRLREILELIETILIYKLPKSSHQEIEAMFSLSDLKQTKVYQEALEEGREKGREEGRMTGQLEAKLESVPRLLTMGLSIEQVASALDLPLEQVRRAANLSQEET